MRGSAWYNPFQTLLDKVRPKPEMADAIKVVHAYRVQYRDDRIAWFGWPLRDDVQERYWALGFTEDDEVGLDEARGFVIDVVSGHRRLGIEDRAAPRPAPQHRPVRLAEMTRLSLSELTEASQSPRLH